MLELERTHSVLRNLVEKATKRLRPVCVHCRLSCITYNTSAHRLEKKIDKRLITTHSLSSKEK